MSIDIVADALASADAEAQAQFINNFSRCLKILCKGRDENQLCYIADHLDENGRAFVKDLQEFIVLAMESRAKTELQISELYGQRRILEEEIAQLKLQKDAESLCQ